MKHLYSLWHLSCWKSEFDMKYLKEVEGRIGQIVIGRIMKFNRSLSYEYNNEVDDNTSNIQSDKNVPCSFL